MLQQHNRLKNFAVEFVQKVKTCAQYSSAVHQNRAWQNLNVLTINAKKRQKRIKESIKFMKQRWSNETINQLMLEVRDHHVTNEVVKFVKKYFIDFEKIMKRLQLTIFKYRKKMNRDIRATAIYILNDFNRVHSKTYSDLFALIRKNFRAADLIIKDMKLIKNLQVNTFFDDDFVKGFSITASRVNIIEIDTSTSLARVVVFKFLISKIVFIISRKALQVERINQSNKSSVISSAINSVSFQVRFFNFDKKVLVFFINQDIRLAKHEFSSVISENVLNEIFQKDISERILKRILLSNTVRLSEIVRSETNKRLLNAFNNAAAFIFDINDYTASICVCVEVFSILRYKITNIRSTLNELMLIITELKNVHERNKGRVCLKHWRKMIFLTNAILRSLLLFSFSKIIVSQEIWISFAMIQKNNRFFHEKIIKNYINMIIERLVNAFNKFVKKIKWIDMTVFDINVYWNVTSNISVASSSTFKSFMLISDFATFRSSEKLDVDTRMRSQSAERFKRIVQQIFKKLNLKRSRIKSSSNQLMKNWKKKTMILMISKTRLSVRDDYSSWLHDIVTVVYNN